jgi:HNH endonuclease
LGGFAWIFGAFRPCAWRWRRRGIAGRSSRANEDISSGAPARLLADNISTLTRHEWPAALSDSYPTQARCDASDAVGDDRRLAVQSTLAKTIAGEPRFQANESMTHPISKVRAALDRAGATPTFTTGGCETARPKPRRPNSNGRSCSQNPTLLRASHIKPWRICDTAHERLDGFNGLMLAPHADFLFDRGLICFEDDGRALFSSRLAEADARKLGLHQVERPPQRPFRGESNSYFQHHRTNVFIN